MDTTKNLIKGQVVKSIAGRDKGKVFVICDIIDDQNVLICDGDLRKIDSPKKKKIKHLMVYKTVIEEFVKQIQECNKINDAFIKDLLSNFK